MREAYDAACEPTCHEREAEEEDETRSPHSTSIRVGLFTLDSVLVDEVHDEVAKDREDARDPVDEGDVYGCGVVRRIGGRMVVRREHGSIKEEPVGKCELCNRGVWARIEPERIEIVISDWRMRNGLNNALDPLRCRRLLSVCTCRKGARC